ncbi:uncharacterized protein [Apostichopus japonicus]|uniref:uncharacterized protein isoform X1 n=1 Tax=Stichopus japonicus TaxID=307972 RepID=UPI003AB10A68
MAFIAENWYCCCSHRTGSFASSIILLILSFISTTLYVVALFDVVIGHQDMYQDGFFTVTSIIHYTSIGINTIIHTICSIILFLSIFYEKAAWIACFSISLLITTLMESTLASFTVITYQTQTLPVTRTIIDYPIIIAELVVCFFKTIFQIHLIISKWCLANQLGINQE